MWLRTIVLVSLSLGCAPRAERRSIDHAGETRSYDVHVPSAEGARPLVVMLHGGGLPGDNASSIARYTGFSELSDEEGFIIAYPAARGSNWNDGRNADTPEHTDNVDDVGFLRAVVAEIVERDGADASRVYFAGISNGAMMSMRMICESADIVRGAFTVVGNVPAPFDTGCHPSRPVPITMVHGNADSLVPPDGGVVAENGGGRGRGEVLSTQASFDVWSRLNGCADEPVRSTRDDDPNDGTTMDTARRSACLGGSEVVWVRLHGAGHNWPGARWVPFLGHVSYEMDATREAWRFFAAHGADP